MIRLAPATRRTLAMLLIAAALLVRAVVPQGWMVEQHGGGIAISVCNSAEQVVIPMKRDGQPTDDAAHGKACGYAAHSVAATPPDALALPPLPQLAAAVWDATRATAQSPARTNPLPPATGPPVLA